MGTISLKASTNKGVAPYLNMEWRQLAIQSSAVDLAISDYNLPSMRGQTIKIDMDREGNTTVPDNYDDIFLQNAAKFFENYSVLREHENVTYNGLSIKAFRKGFYPRMRGKNLFGGVHWPAPAEFLLLPLTTVNLLFGVACWAGAHIFKTLGDDLIFLPQLAKFVWRDIKNNPDSVYRNDNVAKGLAISGLILFPLFWLTAQSIYSLVSLYQYSQAILDGVTNLCVSLVSKLTCCFGDEYEYASIGYSIKVILINSIKLAPLAILTTVAASPDLNAITQVIDNLLISKALPFVYTITLSLLQAYGAMVNLASNILMDSFNYCKNKLTSCFCLTKKMRPQQLSENSVIIQPSIQFQLQLTSANQSSQSNLQVNYDVNSPEAEKVELLSGEEIYEQPVHQLPKLSNKTVKPEGALMTATVAPRSS